MEGLCAPILAKRTKRRMNPIPVGIMDDADATHEGIKTVECNNHCDHLSNAKFKDGICICTLTWNTNGQVRYEDIKKLVENERQCDLLVIGLQEVPRSNVLELLEIALHSSLVLLEESVMQSLQLYIFGSKKFIMHTQDIKIDKQGVGGCGGLIRRKKGATAIKITYRGIHMIFITCHLAAHARNVQERNSECRHISNSLFSKNSNPYAKPAQLTVWLGDLNYRLQDINTSPARDLIQRNLHKLLTHKDQLLQEAEKGQVFNGYCEGNLSFKPTYKYNVGTNDYDTSYKGRVPAWTDRILYKIEDKDIDASLHLYESVEDILNSDHKPVKAHLCLKFNKNHDCN